MCIRDSTKGRATMGVMLVRLDEGGHVVGFDRVDEGGQTGRDLDEELDDVPPIAAVEGAQAPAGDAADAAGDEASSQRDEPEDDA